MVDKGMYWMYVVQLNKAVSTTSATLGMHDSVVRGKGTRCLLGRFFGQSFVVGMLRIVVGSVECTFVIGLNS